MQLKKQRGVTLIELMISLLLGLIISGIIYQMYMSFLGSNAQVLSTIRLNHEIRTSMDMIVRDLRRAGYSSEADVADNPYTQITIAGSPVAVFNTGVSANTPTNVGDCVVFGYEDKDGNDRLLGYRWDRVNDSIEVNWTTSGATSSANASCSGAGWSDITDPETTEIIASGGLGFGLQFSTIPNTAASFASASVRSIKIDIYGRSESDNLIDLTVSEEVRIRNDL